MASAKTSRQGLHPGGLPGMALLLLVALALIAGVVQNGWVPMDEGQLGHSAERVLRGELPHRDFDEPYSGGLAFYHAGLFGLLGVGSTGLAWSTVPFYLVYVACVLSLARRFVGGGKAMGAGILCAMLGLPLYPAPMPSWFNLFFSVFACLAMVVFFESNRRRYLVLAGVCCGLSVCIKVTGLYTLGAAFLALVFFHAWARRASPGAGWQHRMEIAGALVFAGLACWHFSRSGSLAANMWLFTMPVAVLAAVAALAFHPAGLRPWVVEGETAGEDVAEAPPACCSGVPLREHVVLAAGFLAGLLPLVGPYAWQGALPDLVHGLLLAPQQRLDAVRVHASWLFLVGAVPLALAVFSGFPRVRRALREGILLGGLVALGVLAMVGALVAGGSAGAFETLSWLVGGGMPVLVLAGAAVLLGTPRPSRGALAYTVLAFGVVASWILYPFSFWGYVPYFSAFTVLGTVAVLSLQKCPAWSSATVLAVLAAVLAALAIVWEPFVVMAGGTSFKRLETTRSQTLVPNLDADALGQIVRILEKHTRPDEPIFATPDAPHIYYLANRRNPTRTFYEVLSRCPAPDPATLRGAMRVRMVVVMAKPFTSPPPTEEYLARLQAAFPFRIEIRMDARPQESPLYATIHATFPLPESPVVWISPR